MHRPMMCTGPFHTTMAAAGTPFTKFVSEPMMRLPAPLPAMQEHAIMFTAGPIPNSAWLKEMNLGTTMAVPISWAAVYLLLHLPWFVLRTAIPFLLLGAAMTTGSGGRLAATAAPAGNCCGDRWGQAH